MTLLLNREPKFEEVRRDDLLHGITQLKTQAQTLNYDGQGRLQAKDVTLPFFIFFLYYTIKKDLCQGQINTTI